MTEGPWVVLYDANCGLCRRSLTWLLRWDRAGRLEPVALESPRAATILADLDQADRMDSWHLISPNGRRWSAGAAAPPLLRLLPGGRLPARAMAAAPGLTERVYRLVAGNRGRLGRLLRNPPDPR